MNDWRLFYFRDEWRRYRASEALFPDNPERQHYIRLCRQRAAQALMKTLKEINDALLSRS